MAGTATVIDPRLPPVGDTGGLAERPGELAGRRVVLFDNGKLDPSFGGYAAIFDVLAGRLEADHGAEVARARRDLLACTLEELEAIARQLADDGVAGVVLAVCDTGVSMPTTILAAALERRGVPTATACHGIGFMVALATLHRLLPGAPLTELPTDRMASYDEVRDELTRWAAEEIVAGLLATPEDLRARFAAAPAVRGVASRAGDTLELDGPDATLEFTARMRDSGLGDGFPLVPPTAERVDAMTRAMGGDGDGAVWPALVPRMAPVTVRDVAVVAVMAGCEPELGRLVLTAYRAMARDEFRLFQAAITTHPAGTLVLVSGPEAERAGLATSFGSIGPGNAANAALGRAVALSYNALLGVRPGGGDLSLQGSPAEYSYCVAENTADSPWPGQHAEAAPDGVTLVTVLKCEGPHNVLDNVSTTAAGVLRCVAAAMHGLGRNNSYNATAQTVVFLNPEHAAIVAADGWSKEDVRLFLFDQARSTHAELAGGGIAPIHPPWFEAVDRVPIVRHPDDILVVVTGGPGPQSQVALPWGYSRGVTLPCA